MPIQVQSITTVLPVDDLAAAVHTWQALLDIEPTFIDSDRWAQFDFDGRRIALAGTDRTSDKAGVMIKVDDLEATRTAVKAAGLEPGPVETGAHEVRATAEGPGGWAIIFYAAN